ncbi:MAG: hypothetical protein WCR04_09950 [Fibrobacteraceae bacterium]
MQDTELYAQILGVVSPWKVDDVEFHKNEGEIHVFVSLDRLGFKCPECGAAGCTATTRNAAGGGAWTPASTRR